MERAGAHCAVALGSIARSNWLEAWGILRGRVM
jgi:hypothetical protein